MICFKTIKKYCCDDISLIENYDKAINDKSQTWVCHHRLEIDLNLTHQELINIGRYYNVPASELIFLTAYEHKSMHMKNSNCNRGKNLSKNHRQKISESVRKYFAQKKGAV